MPHWKGIVRRIALLISVLVAAAVPAAPASAAVDTSFTCPPSIASAGFADLAANDPVTVRAVDCLAVHGITRGTGPTTFEPSGTVPRWQMALFLVRQAEAHGVTIPDGSDQGFTDLGGLTSEARIAVNRLGQLGITLGTGPGTFSPHEPVTRWQMALFITRLLAASGIALPTATDQGFADLGSVSDQARRAISQLAGLGIAEGTGPATFSPSTLTLRWHMALFLTRALAVAGVLPPGTTALQVTPTSHAYLDFTGATVSRAYTVAVSVPGPVTLELWPAATLGSGGTFLAATASPVPHCDLTLVDGEATGGDRVSGVEPAGHTVTFTVGCAATGEQVVPVVYSGLTLEGLTGASSSNPVAPTNAAVGFGGGLTVVRKAASGPVGPMTVGAVHKASKSFESGGATWFWDDGDVFRIGGVAVTMAAWEAALSSGDVILAGSSYSAGGASVFDLDDIAPLPPALSLVAVSSTSVTLTYVAAPGSDRVEILSCTGVGCSAGLIRSVLAGTDEDPGTPGTQLVIGGLLPATTYEFRAVQVEDTDSSAPSDAVVVATPVAVAVVDVEPFDVNDGDEGWQYLFVTFDSSVVVADGWANSDFQIHVNGQSATKLSVTSKPLKPFGTSNELALEFSYRADTTPDTQWVLTIAPGALLVGAGGDPNGALTVEFEH